MDTLASMLIPAAAIGAAAVGGIFFTFSNFVMPALKRLPPAAGAAAMQSINVTVLNPGFFAVFFGTVILGIAGTGAGALRTPSGDLWPAIAGVVCYGVGCIAVTGFFNIPLNNALAAADPDSQSGEEMWKRYLGRWVLWNHVRTVACFAAGVCFALSWW